MRRLAPALLAVALLAVSCGGGTAASTTTVTVSTTSTGSATTEGVSTTAAGTTSAPTTTSTAATAPTTTVAGAYPVEDVAYCVRGTDPSDALNVRSGPGTSYEVVGRLAWDATGVPAGGLAAPDDRQRLWYLVGYDGGMGWAAGWYLVPAPCEAAAADPAPLAGEGLPDALSGGLVPWAWVDEDWVLALYAATWDGPRVLYLLGPYGDTYELFVWPTTEVLPYRLDDWRPDGRAALIQAGVGMWGDREIRLLDLVTRDSTTVAAVPELAEGGPATFTRPTGRDIVYATGDAANEVIEVHRTDGSLFSTLLDQPRSADWRRKASWLYGLEGTTVVVGTGTQLQLLTNHGDLIRALDHPGEACRLIRWWDPATVLARCLAPEVLAYLPEGYYHRLWLVPVDGSPATPLTALPPEAVDVVDFGYWDARLVADRVFAQWTGDCGAAEVRLIAPDGTATPLTGQKLIGSRDGALVIQRWEACDLTPGSLDLVGLDGRTLATLIEGPADGPGVIDALMLGDLP